MGLAVFPFFLLLLTLCSCRNIGQAGESTLQGDTIAFRYAQLLHITEIDGGQLATIDNPWKEGLTLHRYLLVPRENANEKDAKSLAASLRATLIRTPLERSIVFTSVHAALLSEIGAERQLAGVADLKYMKVPWIHQGVARGTIADCGDGMAPLIEKIIETQADAILLSPFENAGGYGRLEEVGTPIIECAEYMEASPLARAEWVRFYGMLYGVEHRADSLFAIVDSSYHALCKKAQSTHSRPTVLVDKQTGSVWYVPGGRSTIGQMLADAGCRYPFATDDHSGSLPLTFETVLERAGESDVWLFRYDSPNPITMRQLLSEQDGYRMLTAIQHGRVYACNVSQSMFYEETPFRPDLLLQDFIAILHPELSSLPPTRYYKPVAPLLSPHREKMAPEF